jgi:hypothetical protein
VSKDIEPIITERYIIVPGQHGFRDLVDTELGLVIWNELGAGGIIESMCRDLNKRERESKK